MTSYLYLFRGGETGNQLSPDQMQAHMQKWGAWIGSLSQSGKYKGGDPLEAGGKTLSGQSRTLTDGPFAEAKDVIGGYLLVTAENEGEAIELASGCPIFETGGAVEVRTIRPM